jgi:hypothetical protein
MGFLDSLMTYAGSWEEVSREKLSKSDVQNVQSIQVVTKEQDWGTSISMCFTMVGGGKKFVPLSRDSELQEGDRVHPNTVEIITLEKDGESPIHRADGEAL